MRGLVALTLSAVIIASGLFYVYTLTSNPVKPPPTKPASFRYDEALMDGFENGDINPAIWSYNGSWQVSSGPQYPSPGYNCYEGEHCAWSGTVHSTNSQMVLNFSIGRSFVNYINVLLNFSLWLDTNPVDTLYVDYFTNGNWNVAAQYSGHMSTTQPLNKTFNGWTLPQLTLPIPTTMMRFRFSTGCCEILYKGVFIDLVGVYMVGPSSFGKVTVFGRLDSGVTPLSIPLSMDTGPNYKTFAGNHFNDGLTFLASPGNHMLNVLPVFSEGSNSYVFVSWSDGSDSPTRTVNVPTSLQFVASFRLG